MQENGFCQKDNVEIPLDGGCRHPGDYCQFRQACMVHFLEKENKKNQRIGNRDQEKG